MTMNRLYLLSIAVMTLMIPLTAFTQGSPEELAKKFFSDYEKEGVSLALDKLYATNEWISKAADAVTNLKNQMEGLNEDFVGKYYGYELIAERRISNTYVLLSYLVKFDRQPIRYNFHFYKPGSEWKIYNFNYDGNIDDEIEESAKFFYWLQSTKE